MEEKGPSSTPQPTEAQQPPQNPQPPATTASSAAPTASSSLSPATTTTSVPNPNPTPAPKPQTAPQSQQSASQTRPPFNTRPWQQPPHSHFTLPSPPPASSASASSSVSAPPPPRGGIAVGVPAHNPSTPPPPSASFSSLASPAYGHQSQIRQPMQGMGMTGTTTSSMRPGVPSHQLRPSQSPLRPPTTSTQSPASQNFQGGSMLRVPTMGSPSPGSPQSTQPQNQPWLSSGSHGKPPLPTSSLRPQTSNQSFQQRSHVSQHNMPTTSQQQQSSSSTQQPPQPSSSAQPKDHSRVSQSITRAAGLGAQKQSLSLTQSVPLPGSSSKPAAVGAGEPSNRILSKRSIQDILKQIDPTEKLDPGVEDVLVDIAEDFVDSVTTFGCALARHRKSSTLEAKDILLHLEKNWYMNVPGFGGDEIRTYKKPVVLESHKERLAAIKRSTAVTDTMSKSVGGASGGNTRGHSAKGGPVIREAA